MKRTILWSSTVRRKLIQFRSEHFSPEETFDFISQIVLETEALVSDHVFSKAYTEEDGPYRGMSRVVIRRFRIYFEQFDNDVLIVAVLFPGEK